MGEPGEFQHGSRQAWDLLLSHPSMRPASLAFELDLLRSCVRGGSIFLARALRYLSRGAVFVFDSRMVWRLRGAFFFRNLASAAGRILGLFSWLGKADCVWRCTSS